MLQSGLTACFFVRQNFEKISFAMIQFSYQRMSPFKLNNSVGFHQFTVRGPKRFHHPKKRPCALSPLPSPVATTNLLPVSLDLPLLDISYKWDPALSAFCVWLLGPSMMFVCVIRRSTSFLDWKLYFFNCKICIIQNIPSFFFSF